MQISVQVSWGDEYSICNQQLGLHYFGRVKFVLPLFANGQSQFFFIKSEYTLLPTLYPSVKFVLQKLRGIKETLPCFTSNFLRLLSQLALQKLKPFRVFHSRKIDPFSFSLNCGVLTDQGTISCLYFFHVSVGLSKTEEKNMNVLGDDELGLILNRITDPDDRKSASLVSKRWLLMEGLTRSSPKLLPRFLSRFPNLDTFKTTKCISNANLVLLAQTCPKLEVIDLTTVSIRRQVGDEGLCALASGCPEYCFAGDIMLGRLYLCPSLLQQHLI
ncbi:putative leucine-rich repeat domain, L domain-containing protein [Rosa chinensis]|uniref:Putative leucine-rich repeat domain, L domain-containing protein n=1 Tax=Rosa chinensis TaxID=74649 RepID=A0A2P6Q019_ROSCH|nr:putative leucine-rich repeat domain, L domain-containing protein [Rosa chinensis]